MSLAAKVEALSYNLGVPPDLKSTQKLLTACEMLGVVPEPGTNLMQLEDQLIDMVSCSSGSHPRSGGFDCDGSSIS